MHAFRTTPLLLVLSLGCSVAKDTAPADTPGDENADAPRVERVEKVVASEAAIDDLQSAFKAAVGAAGPAVVSVYSRKTVTMARSPMEQLFGGGGLPQERQHRGLGSGFVIDDEGLILTNNHVVDGADSVKVKFSDDREFDATVVGADRPTDLALLRIEAEDLTALPIGNSEVLEVGDWVLAIGNPFGLPQTVSAGIVSAKGRADVGIVDYENFIQTDAAVNPGNSGGPLVDLDGKVVGINTAIASRSGGNDGIAFAIPIDMAMEIVTQLREKGRVERGHLGIIISDLEPDLANSFGYEGEGILVQDVVEGGPADAAGLRSGDIIIGLAGEPVAKMTAFRADVAGFEPGSKVALKVWRDGKSLTLHAELGAAPSDAVTPPAVGGPPKLGLGLQNITPQTRQRFDLAEDRGVLITSVEPGSPAADAGVRPGDVLEKVGDTQVRSVAEAVKVIRDVDLERGVRLRINRGGQGRFVFVKVE
ncbi:MAG: Do family serine endopeptidase [Nannocystaceae bacterium]|nr:Do family serine endopeptidase [bacterium]